MPTRFAENIEAQRALAKNTKGRATAEAVKEAIDNADTFVFGELLAMSNVKDLEDSEHKPVYELLKIFAYGTLRDYKENKEKLNLPNLTDKQLYKLKQLSLVSLGLNHRVIPYSQLQSELEIDNVRELEDLLIASIYRGIISGKIDQKEKCFEVHECCGRDVKPEEIGELKTKLEKWLAHSQNIVNTLKETSKTADEKFEIHKKQKEEVQEKIDGIKNLIKEHVDVAQLNRAGIEFDEAQPKTRRNRRTRF
eukprot:gb/GECH01013374.1/.p1 GENE.gb/GECH01013374.1/~~gb/GECH01013374.1/.p1  ORF type:complete len:251 (+),score=73.66 gb/GECH01013374.1/:1-753(+)